MWTQHDDPEESKFEKYFFCKTVGDIKAHMTKHPTKKGQVCSLLGSNGLRMGEFGRGLASFS